MSNYTRSHNDLLVGDFSVKSTAITELTRILTDSGYAVNVVPDGDRFNEWYRVIITEAKGGFYE